MSNHRARTWDHKGSKPLDPKLLLLDHHLDGGMYPCMANLWPGFPCPVPCDRLYLYTRALEFFHEKWECIGMLLLVSHNGH